MPLDALDDELSALNGKSPHLDVLLLDLMIGFRAAIYTAATPHLILDHLKAYHDGVFHDHESTALAHTRAVTARLDTIVPELPTNRSLRKRIFAGMYRVSEEVEAAERQVVVPFEIDQAWEEYLQRVPFQLMIWGSQRLAYLGLYNSYEDFLVHCVKHAARLQSIRVTQAERLEKHLREQFGDPAAIDNCWLMPEIHIAREARHAISHAGGRETTALSRLQHHFRIVDERIQIGPSHLRDVFSALAPAILLLARIAATHPQFQR